MIGSLKERVLAIYEYLDGTLKEDAFREIAALQDGNNPLYGDTKEVLDTIRYTTGVRYLYTATKTPDGTYIYLVDGLPLDSIDFRNVGDPIEEEIIPDIERAWSGEKVLPDLIKDTSWGHIFIAYLPFFSEGQVIGVVGVEFDAGHQYDTYLLLKWITPVVIVLACILAAIFAAALFRRISNPSYQDLANTDMLTGLKNRNAFETDLHNLSASGKKRKTAFLAADLDRLKCVNDTLGHQAGDRYIQEASKMMARYLEPGQILYRIGGDEFAVIIKDGDLETVTQLAHKIIEECKREKPDIAGEPSPDISIGYAAFDQKKDRNLYETLKRADDFMYEEKRKKKLPRADR